MRNIVPSNQTPTRRELTRSEESNLRMQLKSLLVIQNNDDKYEVKILLDAVIDKVRSGDKSVDTIKKELTQMQMRICDAETTQRIGRCILEFKRELDRSDRESDSEAKSNKIGGNEMFSAQSAAEKHRRELQMLRSGLKKGDSSARVSQYNKQCDEDKNKYTSGQVLEPEVNKTLVNDESTRTSSSTPTTSFEHTTCSYQHNVHPFRGNPRECNGYPPAYVKNEPKHELNFFLTEIEGENKQNEENMAENKNAEEKKKKKRGSIFKKIGSSKKLLQEKKTKEEHVELENGLACSLVSREALSFEKLKKQVSSPESGKFKTKPVIILCHGAMSWRNQMLLANISAELLALLDVHILRFDFTGSGHSKGEWRFGNFTTESEDLSKVIDFVKNSLRCQVGCVIGHSQGAASVLNYASHIANQESEGGKDVNPKCFVNLAGRYRVPGWDPLTTFGQERQVEVMKNGFFNVNSEWGDDDRIFKITEEALGAYKFQRAADTAKVIFRLRRDSSVRVLTIHGYEDEVVPVHDAFRFDEEIANHNLHVIKQADHNFNGLKYIDEMVLKIVIHYKSVNGDK